MLAHIGLYVDDLRKSDSFYRPLLKVIGYEVILEFPQCIAYGMDGNPYFEIYTGKAPSSPIHVAFHVPDERHVNEFHETALALGGKDNGKPGPRTWEQFQYYAAFITDPNGHNLEALCSV